MNWCGSGAAQPTPSRRCLETTVGPAGLCSVLFAHQTGLAAAAALIWNVNRLLQYHSRERAHHASELRSLSCSQQHLGTIKPPSWPSLYPTHLHVPDATVTCAHPMHQNFTIIFVVSSFIFSVLLLTAGWSVVCEYFWDEDVWTASSCCDSTVDVVKEAWADVMYINIQSFPHWLNATVLFHWETAALNTSGRDDSTLHYRGAELGSCGPFHLSRTHRYQSSP